jgi:hypothetical protein
MDTASIITALDDEIARLQQVRSLLADGRATDAGLTSSPSLTLHTRIVRKRKPLSKEAKARIAAAQKRRWAKQKAEAQAAAK